MPMAENIIAAHMDRTDGHVLVVDDVRANRFVLERMLSKVGCSVTSAEDGPTALRLSREFPPDLALIDVMMPGMSGYEVCRRLKEDPRTKDTPVIMVTALSEIEDLEEGFDAGAMDYICRPFNPRELVVRVRNALRLKHQEDRLRLFQARLSRELELAGVLQETMLSMPPLLSGTVHVSTAYKPSLNVSGDLFDRVLLPDGRVCLYVADCAGHGVAAAMVSSLLKATFTEVIHSAGSHCSPSMLCSEVEARFRRTVTDPSMYATALLAICDPASSHWQVMSCGHPSPMLLATDGTCRFPCERGGGTPIGFGFHGNRPYRESDEVTIETSAGDLLFFYTDGLIEAQHEVSDDEFGVDNLVATLRNCCRQGTALGLGENVFEAISGQGYKIAQDDCSIMVAETVSSTGVLFDGDIPASLSAIQDFGATVETVLLERGWRATSAAAVQLVVVEHGNNAVIHGRLQSDEALHYLVQDAGGSCRIVIRDPGATWDYPDVTDGAEMPSVHEQGGRGIPMILRIGESTVYYRDRDRNVMAMSVLEGCGDSITEEGVE